MDKTRLEKPIPEALAGERLDRALARMFPEYSRSRLKEWLLQGYVTVDNESPRPRDPVHGGEQVVLKPPGTDVVSSEPEPIELEIAYEDDDLLVVNKPPGLVVHPGAGNPRGTLMNGLLAYDAGLRQLPRAGIVHRLDKETSGLLLVGRNIEAHTALVRALAEREIERRYIAVCSGVLTGGGKIDAPIARHPVDRVRMAVVDNGKPAVTHYRVLERFRGHTLVDVRLETGRTHQIRVHFAYRRHPLLGDPVYGGRMALPRGAGPALETMLREFSRQALHAAHLQFAQPKTGAHIDVSAELPADLRELLTVLREDAAAGTVS